VCNDGKPFKQLCKFVWFNSRNLTESSLKALFSAARETSLTRFLAVPGVPVHTTVLGGCAHIVRVPRCQRRHRGGARSAPRREIEFTNSREKYSIVHLNTMNLILACLGCTRMSPIFQVAGEKKLEHPRCQIVHTPESRSWFHCPEEGEK